MKIAKTMKSVIAVGSLLLSLGASAESNFNLELGAEGWFSDVRLRDSFAGTAPPPDYIPPPPDPNAKPQPPASQPTRRSSDSTFSGYLKVETSFYAVPEFSLRVTPVETSIAAFDKYDFTLYYNVLDHELMMLDLGLTYSSYRNSSYTAADSRLYRFDHSVLNAYAYAEIRVPNTSLDIIGQFDFGDGSESKTADVFAGLQYGFSLAETTVKLRGGYRVIDVEMYGMTKNSPSYKDSFIFVDGWFLGTSIHY